jgi:hypothetical protein
MRRQLLYNVHKHLILNDFLLSIKFLDLAQKMLKFKQNSCVF